MSRSISPGCFALWQGVGVFLPWVSCAAMLVAGGWALFAHMGLEALGVIAMGLANPVLGYAPWAFGNDWHGLVRRPKSPWTLRVQEGRLNLDAGRWCTSLRLGSVESSTRVMDMSWETLRGVEDVCLVLRLACGSRICLPGSSVGYKQVEDLLEARPGHARLWLNDDQ